ncbi:FAD-binding oxidoreductase [Helcobacillus sp. ACRRO]|uniref:FAD-binding and (Fe-S)-binding domain-containing protein n=1 Tax=Helcobacillus sp. ACRRO TaxID=2918202 RepID=UPI001EF45EC4|nr:FAD-binding and (Fe-S)-binding domain-containing protein [Helcobacillus sp. ACRRO]MCG7427188.1 FAD-binding oxidoreductase [Helcobacillus sp. ACRRO]
MTHHSTVPGAIRDAVGDPKRLTTRLIDRAARAGDASHYLLTPSAVITAADAPEVGRILAAATASRTPVTIRSGGTSLSGQASTDGILIDVRQRFRTIDVLDGGERVRAGSGMTIAQVNNHLRRHHRRLGPDPASEAAATIGGVIANNSSGMACGTEQNTYRTLESMRLVLPTGTLIDTADPHADRRLRDQEPDIHDGLLRLRERIRSNPASVAAIQERFALKNTMGYGINAFLDAEHPIDILRLLIIGSEGTLGFVADATFRTVGVPPFVTTGLGVFPSLDAAARALPALVDSGAATLELMDSTSIAVGQELADAPPEITGFRPDGEAALLIEYRAETAAALAEQQSVASRILAGEELRDQVRFSEDPVGRASAWALRKGLYASVAGARPTGTTALLEDIVVPPASLADTCADLQDLFAEHRYGSSVIFGHAKDGNIHFMLTDRFEGDDALGRYDRFTESMVDLVLSHGGNLKAEHGTGRAMAPFVHRQYGDELYDVMVQLKRLIDPSGIMNPGVIISDDADAHMANIKLNPPVEDEVDRCVECGYCEPVCPSRDLTLTPRQRIVVRRAAEAALARGDLDTVAELRADYDYEGVQTCAVDGMCAVACPLGIDTGALVKRLRREKANPIHAAAWAGAARAWAPVSRGAARALDAAGALPPSVPGGLSRAGRAVLGADVVPRYTPDLPGGGAARHLLGRTLGARDGDLVGIYLPACVSSMFGPADGCGSDSSCGDGGCSDGGCSGGERDRHGVAGALGTVLERVGLRVVIPDGIDTLCCATPWTSKGYAAGVGAMQRRVSGAVRRVVRELSAAGAPADLPIISDASSCTEGYASMLADQGFRVEDAVELVAREALPRLLGSGADGTAPTGAALQPQVDDIVLHPTCSSTQMGLNPALIKFAEAVADTVTVPAMWSCCGFAGDRGMLHPELTDAATADEAAEVRRGVDTADDRDAAEPRGSGTARGSRAFASCNRTCEIGMSRATGEDYRHIIELLADAVRAG